MNVKLSRLQWTITHHDIVVTLLTREVDNRAASFIRPWAWRGNYVRETKLFMFTHEFCDFLAFRGGVPKSVTPDQLTRQFLADLDERSAYADEPSYLERVRCRTSYPSELLFGRYWEQRRFYRGDEPVCVWRPRLMWCDCGEAGGFKVLQDLSPGYSYVDLEEALR